MSEFLSSSSEIREYSTKSIENLLRNEKLVKHLSVSGKRRAEDMWNRSGEVISKYVDPDRKILDVGVGTGQVTEVFIQNLKSDFEDVFTTDIAPFLQVETLKKGYALAKGGKLPYVSESMRTIFITDVLHHTSNPEKILAEVNRVLDPKGTLIVLENLLRGDLPRPLSDVYRKLLFAFDNTVNIQDETSNPHSNNTLEGWKNIASEVGLELVDHKEWQWGLIDFVPGVAEIGSREKMGVLRPFTDTVMVFRKV